MKPSKLMFNRTVRTRLPTVRDPVSIQAVKEAWEKDQQERLKRKEVTDKRKTAQERMVKVGDKVLVAQRKTTTKPPFDPTPYTITEVKGTQVTVEREGKRLKKRNLAKVKILRQRPERLQIKARKEKEKEESTEWWEMPNARPDPEESAAVNDPAPEEEMALQQAAQEEVTTARGHRDFTKEEWQVAMGPWRQKTSPGPKERKRRQQEARRRDKGQARHPYRLRSRKGQEEQMQDEQGELSD